MGYNEGRDEDGLIVRDPAVLCLDCATFEGCNIWPINDIGTPSIVDSDRAVSDHVIPKETFKFLQ
jgi:hypothetical protein